MKTFKQYLGEAKPIFRYVYHIAPRSAIPNIMRQGLIPATESPSSRWKHIKYKIPSIFVITRKTKNVINEILTMLSNKHVTPDHTHDHWTEQDWDNFTNSYVLLTIDLTKCTNVDLISDTNAAPYQHSKVLSGIVPPDSIVKTEPVNFDWSDE